MEPINLYCPAIDPALVLDLLRQADLAYDLVGTPADWTAARIDLSAHYDGRPAALTLHHSRDYYAGPSWPGQRAGLQNHFRNFPAQPRQAEIVAYLGTLGFSLGTAWEPDAIESHADPRTKLLTYLARNLNGVLFLPSCLLDAWWFKLLDSDGQPHVEAQLPPYPPIAPAE